MSDFATWAPMLAQGVSVVGQGIAGAGAASENRQAQEVVAEQELINSRADARQSDYINRKTLAKQRAIAGASGVDVGSGTPMEVYMDSVRQAELERRTILAGGKLRSQAAKYGASLYGRQATQSIWGGIGGLGNVLLKNNSTLSDLFNKGRGSGFTSTPQGSYSLYSSGGWQGSGYGLNIP